MNWSWVLAEWVNYVSTNIGYLFIRRTHLHTRPPAPILQEWLVPILRSPQSFVVIRVKMERLFTMVTSLLLTAESEKWENLQNANQSCPMLWHTCTAWRKPFSFQCEVYLFRLSLAILMCFWSAVSRVKGSNSAKDGATMMAVFGCFKAKKGR